MTVAWKQYQEDAANFFRSLGYSSTVEESVTGVRGEHKIDVLVEGKIHGIDFVWIVECKHWKDNIPKEKVMALMSIVQDVGADKGFLLSEVEFQSGAIRASSKSNITLTSIADLSSEARESLEDFMASKLVFRISAIKRKFLLLHRRLGEQYSGHFQAIGKLSALETALGEAVDGRFPVAYDLENHSQKKAHNWEEFFSASEIVVRESEEYYD